MKRVEIPHFHNPAEDLRQLSRAATKWTREHWKPVAAGAGLVAVAALGMVYQVRANTPDNDNTNNNTKTSDPLKPQPGFGSLAETTPTTTPTSSPSPEPSTTPTTKATSKSKVVSSHIDIVKQYIAIGKQIEALEAQRRADSATATALAEPTNTATSIPTSIPTRRPAETPKVLPPTPKPPTPVPPPPTAIPAPPTEKPKPSSGTIEIIGDAACVSQTEDALNLLKLKAPADYSRVKEYISIIECVDSGSGVLVGQRRIKVGIAIRNAGTIWYASGVDHEACHSEQYYTYRNTRGLPVPVNVWNGREAERQCLDVQYNALLMLGGNKSQLDHILNVINTNYWDVDPSKRWW